MENTYEEKNLLLAISILASFNATADQRDTFEASLFYVGAKTGWASYQDACTTHALECNNDTLGYGLYAGYPLTSWLAIEGGLSSYGHPNARYENGAVSIDTFSTELAMMLSYPLSERVMAFTRLGEAINTSTKHSLLLHLRPQRAIIK